MPIRPPTLHVVTRRVPVYVLAAAAMTAALAGCGVSADVAVERSNQLAAPSPTQPTPPTSPTTDDPANTTEPTDPSGPTTPPQPNGDLIDEGNAKPQRSYDGLVSATIADLDRWWGEVYPALFNEKYTPLGGGVFPAYPERDNDIPGCGTSDHTTYEEVQQFAAFYCSFGDFVAYDDGDSSLLLNLTEQLGDSVIAVVLAHEWGHAIQSRNGSFNQGLPTIYTEQQADCFAGAWTKRAIDGQVEGATFSDADVRAGLVAMIQVRDPLGFDQLDPGGHGSGFDRVGAFQVGYLNGVERCSKLIDNPLPLVPNQLRPDGNPQGNAEWGYDDETQIPAFLPTDLNRYWQAYFSGVGRDFPTLTIQPVQGDDDVTCPDVSGSVVRGAAYCPNDQTVYFDEPFAREQYDEFGDFSVGYILGGAWSEAAQEVLESPFTGEKRALLSDCLTGTWVNDITVEKEGQAFIEAGDLDEAIQTVLIIGDANADDNKIGSGFEKIDWFREGALNDVSACQDQISEDEED